MLLLFSEMNVISIFAFKVQIITAEKVIPGRNSSTLLDYQLLTKYYAHNRAVILCPETVFISLFFMISLVDGDFDCVGLPQIP